MATVPNLIGLTEAAAITALAGVGLVLGIVGTSAYSGRPIDTITEQTPFGGLIVPAGTRVNVAITRLIAPLDPIRSVISQYANSPTILRLIENMDEYVDNSRNLQGFYDFVWNVDTAEGFGLDTLGRIVGVSRTLNLEFDEDTFGFDNPADDWQPFNQGTFYRPNRPQGFTLDDTNYRRLVLTKALGNISATTAPSINQQLLNLFDGRRCFVVDYGYMMMGFTFEFLLTSVEYAILTQSNAILRPAGVGMIITSFSIGDVFGFSEMNDDAGSVQVQPFDQAPMYSPVYNNEPS